MQVIRLPILGTQYKLTEMQELENLIGKNVEALIDINEELGYLADHGTLQLSAAPPRGQARPDQGSANNFRTLVSQNYSLKNINLKENGIPESLNSMVIVRPTEKFSDYALFQIDQFLMQGKSLFLVLDRFNEIMPGNPQGMNLGGQGPQYVPLDTGLEKLLAHYGIRIKKSYVMDENCFRQEMPPQFGGGERAIYFAPMIKNQFINKDLDFMKNIKVMVALKISPLELITERIAANKLDTYKLFASSEKSWEMRGRINLNPLFIQPPSSTAEMQSQPLAYLLEGEFPSYFAGKPIPIKEVAQEPETNPNSEKTAAAGKPAENAEKKPAADLSKIESKGQLRAQGKPGKIIVMASADMLKDNVLDAGGKGANATFVMNAVDYLNNREDIAVMRSKEQRFNPLDDTAAGTKTFVKTFNIAGLPVLVILFGLGVWLRRVSRKKHIQMMFQK
jgi:ABC-type uncharacterized transport system involved in gliding motility auxiliary subunit